MKIEELIAKTPEMTEEKLLDLIKNQLDKLPKYLINRIIDIHSREKYENTSTQYYILKEFDSVQDKKSKLTRSQRDTVLGFVGMCLIQMTKGEDGTSGE